MGISMRISIMFMVRLDTWQRHVQCITVVTQFSNKLITYLLLWNFSSSSCVILDAQLLFHYASYCIIMFFQTYNDFFYKDNSFLLLYCIWYFRISRFQYKSKHWNILKISLFVILSFSPYYERYLLLNN